MIRYVSMLILCLFVIVAMIGILAWFFRKLGKIETERWGNVPDTNSIRQELKRFREKRAKQRATKA